LGIFAARARQSGRRIVVKNQAPTRAKKAWRLPDAVIARRYLDLQRLRDKVKKAEARSAQQSAKKPRA